MALATLAAPCMVWAQTEESAELSALMNASQTSLVGADSIPTVRRTILERAAQTAGMQAGLAAQSASILRELEGRSKELDQKFRFTDLLMSQGVLPPVLSEARDAVAVQATQMQVAGRKYAIEQPARFVSVPPTWRDWLLVGLSGNKAPSPADLRTALPKDDAERGLWQVEVQKAYQEGVAQAQSIFDANLGRLERDYLGMRLFFDLCARRLVSPPIIATSVEGVVSDDPSVVVIGQTVFRITEQASFTKPKKWRPLAP